jgi:hypothetical protein
MKIAQELYENGLITYMRTDSVQISDDFQIKIMDYITKCYGNAFVKKRAYKNKISNAQEAHDAIRIINKTIKDNELYGRRLINKGQFGLLSKYDYVFFSLFIRENMDYWYPIGFIESEIIRNDYPVTYNRPDGGTYPFPASPVPTSLLKSYEKLKNI